MGLTISSYNAKVTLTVPRGASRLAKRQTSSALMLQSFKISAHFKAASTRGSTLRSDHVITSATNAALKPLTISHKQQGQAITPLG